MKSTVWISVTILLLAPTAHADVIDRAMTEQSTAITDAVRDLRANSVAVLPFESEIDDRPATAAQIGNALLAKRLMHLLVLSNKTDPELEILNTIDPRIAKAGWRTPEERTGLFATKLPLAWDQSQLAPPAALVSGRVTIRADLHATIEFIAFTRTKPADLRVLYQMDVELDRGAMADFGVSFSVARPRSNFISIDDPATANATENLLTNNPPDGPDESPVQVQLLLDGVAAEYAPDADSPGNVSARTKKLDGTPTEGQAVTFRLINTSQTETFGVLLAVNGKNTAAFDKDTLDSGKPLIKQRLWMLKPGQDFIIHGFYTKDKPVVYEGFTVMTDAESSAEMAKATGERVGRYQVRIFGKPRSGPPPVARDTEEEIQRDSDRETDRTNLLLAYGGQGLGTVRSLAEAKKRLANATHTAITSSGIVADPTARTTKQAKDKGIITAGKKVQIQGQIEIMPADDFDPQPLVSYDIVYHSENK